VRLALCTWLALHGFPAARLSAAVHACDADRLAAIARWIAAVVDCVALRFAPTLRTSAAV
jgi:hypothetical protein